MAYAPLYEVHKATQQGGLLQIALDGHTVLGQPISTTEQGHAQLNRFSEDQTILNVSRWMLTGSVLFLFVIWLCRCMRNSVHKRSAQQKLRQPLVDTDHVTPPRVTKTTAAANSVYSI